jgi:glycosyltransferase involved in cell wall biosynthesis
MGKLWMGFAAAVEQRVGFPMLNSPLRSEFAIAESALANAGAPQTVSILASDLSQQGAGRWGGAVRPFLLAQALQQAGYGVEIVGFTHDRHILSVKTDVPIRAIPLESAHWGMREIGTLWRHLQGDIIYAYKLKPSSFGLALLHRLRHRRPLLLDIDDWELSWHGGDGWRYRPSLPQLGRDLIKPDGALRQLDQPFYLQQIERLVPYANGVTTHNQFLQQRFGGTYVPNGKDVDWFDPSRYRADDSRRRYGLSDYRVVMFPGAPRPYKGVEDLLTALEQLNQPDLRLVIVGGSPYDDYDQHLVARWGKWIIHLPRVPAEQMPEVIAAAHVVAVPQRNVPAAQAQFPLKLTDGMAMAKPILATRVGDIPHILGSTGYLAEPDSPQDLATQLTAIFADWPQAQALGQQARERCCQHYSMAAMATQLRQVLAGL